MNAVTSLAVKYVKLSLDKDPNGLVLSAVSAIIISRNLENFPRIGMEDARVNTVFIALTHSSNLSAPSNRNVV